MNTTVVPLTDKVPTYPEAERYLAYKSGEQTVWINAGHWSNGHVRLGIHGRASIDRLIKALQDARSSMSDG